MSHLGLRSLWMELWKSVIQADSRMHNVLYMCLDTYIWIQRQKIGMWTFFKCVWSIICQKLGYPIFRPLSSWFPFRCFSYVLSGPLPRSILSIATAWWFIPGMATRGKIYKNADLSAFLYLCLNKSSCLAIVLDVKKRDWDARKYGRQAKRRVRFCKMIEKRDGNSPKTWDYPSVIVMRCNDL